MPLSKKDAVTVALWDCGGGTDTVDTEDVAVAAFERAPTLFRWRKHHDQIDLDGVRVALRHEAEASAPRVAGSVRSGWHLTPDGVVWATAAVGGNAQVHEVEAVRPNVRRAETRHTGSEFARLRTSAAFAAWAAGREVSARNAAAVFRIDHYTSERDKTLKTQRLSQLVEGDDELSAFVLAMAPLARTVARPEGRKAPGEGAEREDNESDAQVGEEATISD